MIVILHNIRSLHNVGSIFRTADAAGVEKIYLAGFTPTPLNEFGKPRSQLTKVALGGEKFVPWEATKRTTNLIKKLKKEGFKILAVEQAKNSLPYYKLKVKESALKKTALVFGSEVRGLPSSVLKRCDKILEIPMYGKKESLNVAVAFGVVVFGIKHNRFLLAQE